jgi:hypothetical protein
MLEHDPLHVKFPPGEDFIFAHTLASLTSKALFEHHMLQLALPRKQSILTVLKNSGAK